MKRRQLLRELSGGRYRGTRSTCYASIHVALPSPPTPACSACPATRQRLSDDIGLVAVSCRTGRTGSGQRRRESAGPALPSRFLPSRLAGRRRPRSADCLGLQSLRRRQGRPPDPPRVVPRPAGIRAGRRPAIAGDLRRTAGGRPLGAGHGLALPGLHTGYVYRWRYAPGPVAGGGATPRPAGATLVIRLTMQTGWFDSPAEFHRHEPAR